jgi:hypothetical protein
MKLAFLTALPLLFAAPDARAAGESFALRWLTSPQCEGVSPEPSILRGSLHIVSDGEWELERPLPCPPIVCAGSETLVVRGTRVRHSARRAVFVGTVKASLFAGPATIEADLALDRDGEVNAVRGTFITPAVTGVCASRGKFRTTKRTD